MPLPHMNTIPVRFAAVLAFIAAVPVRRIVALLIGSAMTAAAANPFLRFIELPTFTSGTGAFYPTALADLNHDGKADLVRLLNGNLVGVQLGLGNGTFGSVTTFLAGAQAARLVIANVNGDTHPDLVVANLNDKTISVLLGNGNGTFQAQVVSAIGLTATSFVATDFNKDGKADLIVTGYPNSPQEGYVVTLVGDGNGNFSNPTTYETSVRTLFTGTLGVTAADFNGDTYPDFIVSNPLNGSYLAVFLNNQNGTFTRQPEVSAGSGLPGSLVSGDFNGDSKMDIAFVCFSHANYGSSAPGANLAVGLGNGDGTIAPFSFYSAGTTSDYLMNVSANVVAADMNGDGILDLVTVADPVSGSQGLVSFSSILKGVGNGTFVPGTQFTVFFGSNWTSVADLDGDGALDLVVTPNSNDAQTYVSGIVPPVFTSANNTAFIVSSPNTFQVTASGYPAPVFSFTGTLPSGVTLSPAGVLSGTPAAGTGGNYPITITATATFKNGNVQATQNFTLVVGVPSLVVTTATDEDNGNPNPAFGTGTSLREAVNYASTQNTPDNIPQTITFAPALAGQTIPLKSVGYTDGEGTTSALRIGRPMIIQGPTNNGITLARDSATAFRLFIAERSLTLNDLTLRNGQSRIGGAILAARFGDGHSLQLNRCTLTANVATEYGSAIVNLFGPATITNCTITGNQALSSFGGAIYAQDDVQLVNTTLFGNTAGSGTAGIHSSGSQVVLINSIVAGNTVGNAAANFAGFPNLSASSANNLIGTGGSGGLINGVNGNLVGVANPGLGTLADNGGPTQTIALLPSSPAINSGSVVAGLTTDQRGLARSVGTAPDIGALEDAGGNDDPDGDTLTNAQELAVGTNPLQIDSDGDGFNDPTETMAGSNPNSAGSAPPVNHVARVLGFGPARGLDLTGSFRYAFNVGTPGAAGQAGDANFTADNASGITVSATNEIPNWINPNFGNTSADDVLETVYRSIRWSNHLAGDPEARKLKVDLAGIVPGRRYKLQLLLAENGAANRVFDVFVSGVLVADDFNTVTAQGSSFFSKAGSALVYEFAASESTLRIVLDGTNVAPVAGLNQDPILIGATLEEIPTAAAIPTIAPLGGTYQSSVNVSITATSSGATIRYTTDGSTPSESTGLVYSGPFTLTRSATVQAIAVGGGWTPSPVASVGFNVLTPLPYWRTLHNLPADGSQDLLNPSGDGVANLLKFAFNMAPNAGDLTKSNVNILSENGTAGLPFIGIDEQGRLVIEFVRRKASTSPGIAYIVETGDDLTNLQPLSLSAATVDSIDATWERVTVTDPVVSSKRFGRVRVQSLGVYFNDFNAALGPATLRGSAVLTNGAVKLTDEVTGGAGAVIFDGIVTGPQLTGFTARFHLALGPTTNFPADGASFAVGDLGAGAWGEPGPGTAHSLAIGFDTYHNGGGDPDKTGMHIWVNGVHLAYNATNPYTNGVSVPVEISFDASAGLTVKFNGATIFNNVPISGFSFQATDKFGIGARTGGFVERATVDNVEIAPR